MTKADGPFGRSLRSFALFLAVLLVAALLGLPARAAPEALHLMDARTGETLYSKNANTPLHPASLTKMLTLYIAFEEIERGNLSLDSIVTVSKNAAAQPPSRLGLKAGQKIQMRYLIRAAAVKSANDAAQAIGDAIGGGQADFAARMTRTARALGMTNSTFKNANGLTAKGHLSTAQDMSILGRRLFYDFPQYYNIFSRRQTDAGLTDVANTNRKFLDAYKGADGIKTGFTQAAGFNLTASAERGNVRLIATIFGGTSTPDRNSKMAKLLDKGFAMAKGNVQADPPPPVQYQNGDNELIANAMVEDGLPQGGVGSSAKTVRVMMALKTSPFPMARPDFSEIASSAEEQVAEMADGIAGALAEAAGIAAPNEPVPFEVLAANTPAAEVPLDGAIPPRPAPRPKDATTSPPEEMASALAQDPNTENTVEASMAPASDSAPTPEVAAKSAEIAPARIVATAPVLAETAPPTPKRQAPIYDASADLALAAANTLPAPQLAVGEVVTRLSTSGGRHWGVNIGRFASSDAAERILLKTQLVESASLGQSLRKVTQKGGGFDANFLGLSQVEADVVCRRLTARAIPCIPLGP